MNDWKSSKTRRRLKHSSRCILILGELFFKVRKLVSRSARSQSWPRPFNDFQWQPLVARVSRVSRETLSVAVRHARWPYMQQLSNVSQLKECSSNLLSFKWNYMLVQSSNIFKRQQVHSLGDCACNSWLRLWSFMWSATLDKFSYFDEMLLLAVRSLWLPPSDQLRGIWDTIQLSLT